MSRFSPLLLLMACIATLPASAQGSAWSRTFGGPNFELPLDARATADGGFIVLGATRSFGAGRQDLLVLKLTSAGVIEWQAAYGGPLDETNGTIDQLADGGYVIVADSQSFGGGLWMLRLDPAGNLLEQGLLDAYLDSLNSRNVVRRLADGGWIVGSAQVDPVSGFDWWIARFGADGALAWQERLGLPQNDGMFNMKETADGTILACGITSESLSLTADGWIVRLGPSGGIVWQRAYSGSSRDMLFTVDERPGGGLIAGGTTASWGAGMADQWVMALDDAGNVLWQRTHGGPDHEYYSFLLPRPTGAVMGGITRSFGVGGEDGLVVWLDDAGDIVRQKAFGGSGREFMQPVAPIADGGFLGLGRTASWGAGFDDLWVQRFDATGNPGADCDFITDSGAITLESMPIVFDTSAVVIPTHAVIEPTDGIRTVIDTPTSLLCRGAQLTLDADIKPGSCPNPLNLNRRGVIPAALTTLGPDDAALIDLASVHLEGVLALRCTIDDVSAPWDETDSCCGTPPLDGFADVMCHFDSQAVAAALCARRMTAPVAGEVIDLALTARTASGEAVQAHDCVRIQTFDCSTVPSPPGHRLARPARLLAR